MIDVCWVLTTGEAGMRSQALGLAEAVGLPIEEKRIVVRRPWALLPGGVLPMPLSALDRSGDRLAPPWPRLVISCGRRSVGAALAVKRLSGNATRAVHVQNPKYARSQFDLVIAMAHDGVDGPNVMTTQLALHGVTPERLADARRTWRGKLDAGNAPFLGVLVGGDSVHYRLTPDTTDQLIRVLKRAYSTHGMRAVITPSRRTADVTKQAISDAIAREPFGRLWDESGDNPYYGILALADRLIVTAESVSMVSEAVASGRPVHVLPLQGRSTRHEAFLNAALSGGLVSRIEGDDIDWSFVGKGAVFPTAGPAARIRSLLDID
jgi:mitochondrial fission protein ELM1